MISNFQTIQEDFERFKFPFKCVHSHIKSEDSIDGEDCDICGHEKPVRRSQWGWICDECYVMRVYEYGD